MPSISRYRVSWSGFPGAPGVSTFYFEELYDGGQYVRTLFDAIKANLPTSVVLTFPTVGDVFDIASGDLVGAFPYAAQTSVQGASAGTYAAPAGALLGWNTTVIRNNRRLKGKTFIVPFQGYENNGSIISTALSTLTGAAAGYVSSTAGKGRVWARPDPSRNIVGGDGAITGSYVPDKIVVLRSRRD